MVGGKGVHVLWKILEAFQSKLQSSFRDQGLISKYERSLKKLSIIVVIPATSFCSILNGLRRVGMKDSKKLTGPVTS